MRGFSVLSKAPDLKREIQGFKTELPCNAYKD
jgi:hypothetical protein